MYQETRPDYHDIVIVVVLVCHVLSPVLHSGMFIHGNTS